MKRAHPLEAGHYHSQLAQPSWSQTRLLKAVVDIMATWGNGATAFEAAEEIVKTVRKIDAANEARQSQTGGQR